jgi:hypothetical protein
VSSLLTGRKLLARNGSSEQLSGLAVEEMKLLHSVEIRMKQPFLFLTVALFFLCATAMAQAPTCGVKNSMAIFVPSDYLTLTPPANKGSSYVDSSFGCTVYRTTNGPADFGDSNAIAHNYIMSPVNADDSMMIVWEGNSGVAIVSFPDGAFLMFANDPSLNGLNTTTWWEPGNAHKIIFAGGKRTRGSYRDGLAGDDLQHL